MTTKDWLTIGLSVAAFCISATTTYFTVLLQQDDLRVVIGDHPFIESAEGEVTLSGDQELTFINSGSRTAAITAIGGIAVRETNPKDDKRNCSKDEDGSLAELGGWIGLDAKSFVIKAGEIVVVKAGLTDTVPWKRKKAGVFYIQKKWYTPKAGDAFIVCISLNVVTPDSYSVEWRRPIYRVSFSNSNFPENEELFEKEKPVIILQRTGTVFRRYLP